ncbi:hypothetical protein PPTG_21971 [Phytophthora nicotianae INRA-310]|uniref:Uncharacterized protein n=3 Tax=Phytophthora nicotianae TaxID=4792 RepID=W2QTL1_PHYN3|nr:hypothetical protein PPTG_21971 [Phytophthora nicotianae INRA-310]ETI55570.1 hypothetical protein F443_01744 [Phytophthora nicotianae P1569]ETM55084.1 hypothetical protein L914_01652 [Phytophthora nicotianae]ETN15620.1 hypothetical protein PPTG_21971 [Phytophthora nicotianae INRA-310]
MDQMRTLQLSLDQRIALLPRAAPSGPCTQVSRRAGNFRSCDRVPLGTNAHLSSSCNDISQVAVSLQHARPAAAPTVDGDGKKVRCCEGSHPVSYSEGRRICSVQWEQEMAEAGKASRMDERAARSEASTSGGG